MRRVETVEAQPARGERVEVRGLEFGVTVVAGVAPALIVGHHEHDVRTRRRAGGETRCSGGKQKEEDVLFHGKGKGENGTG